MLNITDCWEELPWFYQLAMWGYSAELLDEKSKSLACCGVGGGGGGGGLLQMAGASSSVVHL